MTLMYATPEEAIQAMHDAAKVENRRLRDCSKVSAITDVAPAKSKSGRVNICEQKYRIRRGRILRAIASIKGGAGVSSIMEAAARAGEPIAKSTTSRDIRRMMDQGDIESNGLKRHTKYKAVK